MLLDKTYGVVALAVYAYDYVLTLEDEVSLVWSFHSRNRLVDAMYYLARYVPLPVLIANAMNGTVPGYVYLILTQDRALSFKDSAATTSGSRFYWALVFFLVGVFAAEAIMSIRTYAIWNFKRRRLILALLSVLLLGFVVLGPINASGLNHYHGVITFTLIVLNELTVLCLTLLVYRRMRADSETELARVLVRDTMFYFLCILATSIINLNSSITSLDGAPGVPQYGLPPIQLSLHSVLSTRIVLKLRGKRLDLDSREIPQNESLSLQ